MLKKGLIGGKSFEFGIIQALLTSHGVIFIKIPKKKKKIMFKTNRLIKMNSRSRDACKKQK